MRWLLQFVDPGELSPGRYALLVRALALGALLLVAATWTLWTAQHVFPQVPLAGLAVAWPAWVDAAAGGLMVGGWAAALLLPADRWMRGGLALAVLGTVLLVAADQQRLQPWAYLLALAAVVLAAAPPRAAFALLRLLIVSFYCYSALTKLDYTFLHGLGPRFLETLAGPAGVAVEGWPPGARLAGAAIFPLGELLVAIGLFVRPTRAIGLAGAIVLHLALLVILGPWGLDHRPAVLLWNGLFIVQDLLLFGPRCVAEPQCAVPARPAPWPLTAMVGAVLVLPALEPWGWFDTWPGWGLYATSAERVVLQIHRLEQHRLDELLLPFVEAPPDANNSWLHVRIDRWALATLAAPVYPQNRLQLGVARALAARHGLGNRVRAVRFGRAARFTGQRDYDVLEGQVAIEAAADDYWFNTRPRAAID